MFRREQPKTHSEGYTVADIAPDGSSERIEQYRDKTADALHSGADTARRMAPRANDAVRRTGEKLDDAADYIENYDVSRAPRDMGRWLKNHPGPTMLAAAAVAGFFFARSLRRH